MLVETAGQVQRVLAEGTSPWVYVALALVLLAVLILPRRFARRSRILDDPNRRKTVQEELRHSMDRLLVELQETAREINATLDTKMIALNRLIEEADGKIARLEKLQGQASDAVGPVAAADGTPPGPRVVPTPSNDGPHPDEASPERRELEREIYRLADEGKTELEIARLTGTPRGEVELVLTLRRTPDEGRGDQEKA